MLEQTTPIHQYVVYTTLLLLMVLISLSKATKLELVASAPISSPEEHGVFSIHCQVSNLKSDMEVNIYRLLGKGKKPQRLSLNEGVVDGVDERVFLANRQQGGSQIYFLTIIDVTRADQGEYVCKISDVTGSIPDLPSSSVTIDILYFPSKTDPICSSMVSQVPVLAGKELVLNCSSERGNPIVAIKWTKSRTDEVMDSETIMQSDSVYSELRFVPSSTDNGAVFMCTISSSEFPEKTSSCHIGPLVVSGGTLGNQPVGEHIPDGRPQIGTTQKIPDSDIILMPKNASSRNTVNNCKQMCEDKDLFHWVITTVICGMVALIFLIISIILLLKYHFTSQYNSNTEEQYVSGRYPRAEDIYTELEGRMATELDGRMANDSNVVFMKLQRPIEPPHEPYLAIQR